MTDLLRALQADCHDCTAAVTARAVLHMLHCHTLKDTSAANRTNAEMSPDQAGISVHLVQQVCVMTNVVPHKLTLSCTAQHQSPS
jgi:hypothetical protein